MKIEDFEKRLKEVLLMADAPSHVMIFVESFKEFDEMVRSANQEKMTITSQPTTDDFNPLKPRWYKLRIGNIYCNANIQEAPIGQPFVMMVSPQYTPPALYNPREISEIVPGYTYGLPVYKVTDDGVVKSTETEHGWLIKFCKGDKSNRSVERQDGIFVESLIETAIRRLKAVNVGDLATRETSTAITNLEQGLMWLNKRSEDRKIRGVEGTYKK
jgi:hypothetical protein